MWQFNSRKLISLCKRLVKMIEDNQAAELLNDRLNGVEVFYDRINTAYELKNKWRLRVEDMMNEFNQFHCDETTNLSYHYYTTFGLAVFRFGNRYNFFEKRYPITEFENDINRIKEDFFEFVFRAISLGGLSSEFTKSGIAAKQKYLHGEETNHATHA